MSQNNELKDLLYYTDLIYEIKNLAGFEQTKDEETEKRIIEREKTIVEKQTEGPFDFFNRLSDFQQELFEIIMGISRKAGVVFRGLQEISKYPELVKEVLEELEKKVSSMKTGVTANEKDSLYYTDLIYAIKNLAGFEKIKDEEILKRIIKRQSGINPDFTQELNEIIIEISQKAGVAFKRADAISEYPELVKEVLEELEIKVNSIKSGVTVSEVEVANNTTAKTLKRKI